jgi:hypothetical protein
VIAVLNRTKSHIDQAGRRTILSLAVLNTFLDMFSATIIPLYLAW